MNSNHQEQRAFITEPQRETPIWGQYDVVVLGGGPAGMSAATSAAQEGMKTLLIEHYGFLGGMGTAAGVTNFCGLHAKLNGSIEVVVKGFATELLNLMRSMGGLNEPHLLFGERIAAQAYDNAIFKVAADRLTQSAGVELLFHTRAVGAIKSSPSEIKALLIENKSGRFAVLGKSFIDASGDADLSFYAGASFEKGITGEEMMYPTSMFRLNGVEVHKAQKSLVQISSLMDQARQQGYVFSRNSPIIKPQKNPSEWRANVTQLANLDGTPVDGTNAMQMSWAEVQGRSQIIEFVRFLNQHVDGFQNAYLLEIAPQLGVRETRRVVGLYQLSESDVLTGARFEDSIGVNAWMVEEHVAGDVSFRWPHEGTPGFNQLPLRMLIPKGIDNLWVAGRCASMTHGGQSAARVSGACFVMGQAAGVAAAQAIRSALKPKDLPAQMVQQRLKSLGVFLG
jgi:hypothetical protein